MSEKPPKQWAESSSEDFSHTSLAELLPGIDMDGLEQDDSLRGLGAQVKENMIAADNAGRMHYAANLETPFAIYLWSDLRELERSNPEDFEKIKNTFSGKNLIDLAAGENIYGYEVARTLGSTAYIGIEAYNANRLAGTISYTMSQKKELEGVSPIPYTVVAEDILKFLKRLPDKMDGIGFISSGTDKNIFQDYRYNEEVIRELERALAPGEAAIFYDSVFPLDLDEENMDISRINDDLNLVHAVKR